jgi:hypothetical protein
MSLYLKRLLRAVLVSGLGFGGGVGLLTFIFIVVNGGSHAASYGLRMAVLCGLFFSLTLVIVMMLLDLSVKLYLAKGFNDGVFALKQNRELELEGTKKQIVLASRQALLAVPNVKNVLDDKDSLSSHAQTGPSWRSPGEDIEVTIIPVGETTWRLCCISKPKSANVIFDYGKNFENVETWHRRVTEELKELVSRA